MNPSLCIFTVLFSLLVSGCAYHDLKQEMEGYRPAPLLAEKSESPALSATNSDDSHDFTVAKSNIQAQKEQWLKILSTTKNGKYFFQPTPDDVVKLKPVSMSTEHVSAFLSSPFPLHEFDVLVFLRSPAIRGAEAGFRAALEGYSQVTGLDEILRQYSAFTESLMTGIGPMKGMSGTDFPYPGVMALKGEIAHQGAKIAWETYQIAIRKQLTMARETFWNLNYNGNAQRITQEMLTLVHRLETVAKTRYEAGRTSFQDVIRIRIKKEILAEELHSLQKQRLPLEARIREVLDLPPTTPVGFPMPKTLAIQIPTADQLTRLALDYRQEIRRLEYRIGKMERMLTLAETMILPPYTSNISRFSDQAINQVGSGAMKKSFQVTPAIQRGAGLPKRPWFGLNNAYLQQTRQKLTSLQQTLRQSQNSTKTLVQQSWYTLDRAAREHSLYKESIVNLSQVALEVVTRGYESGKIPFADVIASHTTWLTAHLTKAKKEKDFGIAWARLKATVGRSESSEAGY